MQLRWAAVAGQLVTLAVVRFGLKVDAAWGVLVALVALTAASNAACVSMTRGRSGAGLVPAILVFDVLVLTAMLAVSGGASNPFSAFFIVHVALGALLLPTRALWCLVVLTIVTFGLLFTAPEHAAMGHAHGHGWSGHLLGMWIAYALSASFVAHFIDSLATAMRERDKQLADVALVAEQNERLAALSNFSANAAHELGTPLATIAIAARELELALGAVASGARATEDAALICRETERCRRILRDLSSRAGEIAGEMPVELTLAGLVELLSKEVAGSVGAAVAIACAPGAPAGRLRLPPHTVVQIVVNLVRNAQDANVSAGFAEPVEVQVGQDGALLWMRVADRGAGLAPEVRGRLGDPFVTTRRETGGLGLGVYLAKSFATRVGGSLRYEDRAGGGTEATLRVPVDLTQGGAG